MAVENKRIIQKMMNELQQATNNQHQQVKMKRHIANVKILCELMLEERPEASSPQQMTDQEMMAMVGKKTTQTNLSSHQGEEAFKKSTVEHHVDNDSLFDF